jgi:hypothetical protein
LLADAHGVRSDHIPEGVDAWAPGSTELAGGSHDHCYRRNRLSSHENVCNFLPTDMGISSDCSLCLILTVKSASDREAHDWIAHYPVMETVL